MSEAAPQAHQSPVVLVTGGGGFLGRAIVERLVARGDRVRNLSRGHYPELDAWGVQTIQGDIADAETMNRACAGCDVVFHVAAKAGVWGKYADYRESNVCGTRNCLAACRKHGVRRLVLTSSPSVVFDASDMRGVDESVPYPARHASHYSATKAIAEQETLAANQDDLRTVALRPHLIWGPRDNHLVPRIVAQGQAGKLRIIGPGDNRVDTTYIDNAADAHLLAADALRTNARAAGRAFFISNGEPALIGDVINAILAAAGVKPVIRSVSHRRARLAATALELVHTILRLPGEPRLTRFVADELARSHWFDISAARTELGYQPRVSLAEGFQRLETWFRESKHADEK